MVLVPQLFPGRSALGKTRAEVLPDYVPAPKRQPGNLSDVSPLGQPYAALVLSRGGDKRQELPSGRVIIQSATPAREAEWGSTGRREISPILVRCRGFEEWEADVAVEGDSQARKKWRTGVRHECSTNC